MGAIYRKHPATVGVYGGAGGASVMGIDWMTGDELSQAIPPDVRGYKGTVALRRPTRRDGAVY